MSSTAGYNLHLAFLHGNGYCSIHSLFLVATISYSACRIAYLHAAGLLGLSFEVACWLAYAEIFQLAVFGFASFSCGILAVHAFAVFYELTVDT